MSHPISLTNLRDVCRFDPLPDEENIRVRGSDLLALIDAVEEFGRYVADTTRGVAGSGMYGSPLRRAHDALARFEFGGADE